MGHVHVQENGFTWLAQMHCVTLQEWNNTLRSANKNGASNTIVRAITSMGV